MVGVLQRCCCRLALRVNYTLLYLYLYMCVCVCVRVSMRAEKGGAYLNLGV